MRTAKVDMLGTGELNVSGPFLINACLEGLTEVFHWHTFCPTLMLPETGAEATGLQRRESLQPQRMAQFWGARPGAKRQETTGHPARRCAFVPGCCRDIRAVLHWQGCSLTFRGLLFFLKKLKREELEKQKPSFFSNSCYFHRVHGKGVVLCERACFCLLSTFSAPSMKHSLLRSLSLLKTLTGAF